MTYLRSQTQDPELFVVNLGCYRVFHSEPTLAASHLGPCSFPGLSELRKVPALDSTHSRISRLSPSALYPWHLKVFLALEILRPDQGTEAVSLEGGQILGTGQVSHPVLAIPESRIGCPAKLQ